MSKQQKEIQTIKEREFRLKLTDVDVEQLCDKAAIAGLAPEKLIEAFIGDLVNGTHTHGSDERMYANQWYDRCGFIQYAEKNLVTYLARESYLDYFFERYELMMEAEENIRQTEENIKREGSLSAYSGEFCSWKDYVNSDGTQAYKTFEEWLKNEQEYIEQEKLYAEGAKEELQQIYKEFLKWADKPEIPERMDEEVKKAVEWKKSCDLLKVGIPGRTSIQELVEKDIMKSGFKPTSVLVRNIIDFSAYEKKNYTLKELAELRKKNPDFSNHPLKKECFETIIRTCQEQEMERIASNSIKGQRRFSQE